MSGYQSSSAADRVAVDAAPSPPMRLRLGGADARAVARSLRRARAVSPPIGFPGSPERWWGDEALQAEAQAAQAPREERHQAACNILAMRPRSLFSAGVRFATASHIPVDTAQ